jgi:hypothetical protein
MKTLIIVLALSLSGCSIVQWLPSSACEYVSYERIDNQVHVRADCKV